MRIEENILKNLKNTIGLCVFFFMFKISRAQDLHFTQYYNAPLLVNPANTGFSYFYDYRLGINNRTQWAATNVPYKTFSAWGDAQLFRKSLDNGWLGVGGILLNDVAGSGNLSSTKAFASVAYHQYLSDKSILSVGASGGLVQKRVDFSKLSFDNQWNGKFFDITAPTGENIIANTSSYIDLNLGLNYSLFANDNFYFNCGFSLMHFNNPKESFFNSSVVSPKVATRYNAFINTTIKLNDVLIISPTANYSLRGNQNQLVVGFNGQYNLSGEGGNTQLLFGGYFRSRDAVCPSIGIQQGTLQFMYNYDATISNLNTFSTFKNSSEISLIWNGFYAGEDKYTKAVKCSAPRF